MTSPAEKFLSRVHGVKKTGPDRWIFRVPTRKDKHPSGSARELPDGRLLIHDFAGSSALEILEAVGLEFSDLYPDNRDPAIAPSRPEARPFYASDALRCLAQDVLFIKACAVVLRTGESITERDHRMLDECMERINKALTAAGL